MDKVVRRAATLASAARPNANYATHLNTLAHQLLQARDGESAQQIFSVAFANLLPIHTLEGLVGSPSSSYDQGAESTWQEEAEVTIHLRPVSRANRSEQRLEEPIADNRTAIQELLAQSEKRMQEQRSRFGRLFARAYLDIGTIETIPAEDRTLLVEVIDSCLGNSARQYRAPDGSLIVLLNPGETAYTLLKPFLPNEETPETLEPSEDVLSDKALTGNVVEQLAGALTSYRQLLDRLEDDLTGAIDSAQSKQSELRSTIGGKRQQIEDLEEFYELKKAEPEVSPARSERRMAARATLAEHNIASLPLYALLDFVPGLDENAGGRVEYMLEDAGLLDALVVPQEQVAAADALLAAENLSDCRLDITTLNRHDSPQTGPILRFDANLSEQQGAVDWAATASALLPIIQPYMQTGQDSSVRYSMNEDGSWTHGLLAGHASPGPARYIGKATRIHARQRELAELDEQRAVHITRQEKFRHSLEALAEAKSDGTRGRSWLLEGQHGLDWLYGRYKNAVAEEQERQLATIKYVVTLLNQLPGISSPVRLGLFAQRTSGDPHSLDPGRPAGRLFL